MMFRISPKNIRDLSVNFFEAKVKAMKTRIKTPPPLKYNILFEKLKDITTPDFLTPDFSTLNLGLKLLDPRSRVTQHFNPKLQPSLGLKRLWLKSLVFPGLRLGVENLGLKCLVTFFKCHHPSTI